MDLKISLSLRYRAQDPVFGQNRILIPCLVLSQNFGHNLNNTYSLSFILERDYGKLEHRVSDVLGNNDPMQ